MMSIAEHLENIQDKLDQAVAARRHKVRDDLQAKLREKIEKSYETPDVQPTSFYVAVPLHEKDESHFMRLCVNGVIARGLGYDGRRAPPFTWECETKVQDRHEYETQLDVSGRVLRMNATHVGWELAVTIKKKTEKKKTQQTTPQHELPQHLRTDYGADGGC